MTDLRQQLETNLHITSVFVPGARGEIGELWPTPESRARFVHYTSAEAAYKIITTRRLWMRNTQCMADYREVAHGFECWDQVLTAKDSDNYKRFVATLDQVVPGAAEKGFNLFRGHSDNIRYHAFVASFSRHSASEDEHGRLSMWRAFAPTSPRVALIFSIPALSSVSESAKLLFSRVAYASTTDVAHELATVIQNIQAEAAFLQSLPNERVVSGVFQMLLSGVLCTKHEGFREELEWRALHLPLVMGSPLIEVGTETLAGVPQRILKIPLDGKGDLADLAFAKLFDRLIIGPTQYGGPMLKAFVDALMEAGVENPKVRFSEIPLRT